MFVDLIDYIINTAVYSTDVRKTTREACSSLVYLYDRVIQAKLAVSHLELSRKLHFLALSLHFLFG